jgi:hypothetical protein
MKAQPSLGGRLTIANAVAVLVLILAARFLNTPDLEWVWIVAIFALTLPFGWLALLPEGHGPTQYWHVVWPCLVVGANSFAWGYGLAAILKWWFPSLRTKTKPPLDVTAIDSSTPRIAVVPDGDNPYTPPSGG